MAVRDGGFEVQAKFGGLSAAECVVLGGDVGKVVCGSVTEFLVQPHDGLSRKVPHQQALSVTVTGALRQRIPRERGRCYIICREPRVQALRPHAHVLPQRIRWPLQPSG